LDAEAYLRSVREIDALLDGYSREELYAKVRHVAVLYRDFSIADNIYRDIYDSQAARSAALVIEETLASGLKQ
jgi:hypothetical protein